MHVDPPDARNGTEDSPPGGAEDRSTDDRDDLETHLPRLLQEAGMTTVVLDVLTRPPSFRGGEVSEGAQTITRAARDEHRARGFGFWEFALAAGVDALQSTRVGLIKGALRHNSAETIQTELLVADFADHLAAGAFRDLPARHIISLTSIVGDRADNGDPWQLPMLDMGVTDGESALAACIDALDALGVHGALFSSGRSYHFVGNEPRPPRDVRAFLARAQLLSPIIDARWVTHQLLDGRCGLRISTDDEKHRRSHRLVARI